jgi:hypothetical protein
LAPSGIHKYYDMYSWRGFWRYLGDKWLLILYVLISPFTLFIPLNFWLAIFQKNMTWHGWWKIFVPPFIGRFFRL